MKLASRILTLVAGLAATAAVRAVPVAITNAGFEDQTIANGTFQVLVPSGWTVFDPSSIINQTTNAVGLIRPNTGPGAEYFPGGTTEGSNAALVFLDGNVDAPAGLQQTLAAVLEANTRYTLSVDIGNIASGTSLPGSADGGGQFYDLDGFPGYRIELLAGGEVIGFDDNSLGSAIADGQFATASFTVDIGASHARMGEALGIRLINLDITGTPGAPNIEVDFDNVRLEAAAVPEPAAAACLVAMAAFCACLGRRRKIL